MSNPPLPAGCIDIKEAAEILGVSVIALYKCLRAKGWINTGTKNKDKKHNTPKQWAITSGLLSTQERGYPAPFNKNSFVFYRVTVITERGLKELSNMHNAIQTPVIKPLTLENAIKAQAEKSTEHSRNEEREKLLAEFNLPIYPAKAS
jgi:hypothetical protein